MKDIVADPGVAGQARSAVKTQEVVISNLRFRIEDQKAELEKIGARESEAGKALLRDVDIVGGELSDFVIDVLDSTEGIERMVLRPQEGLEQFRYLKEEASKATPNSNALRTFAQRAFDLLSEANKTEDFH